MPAAVLVCSPRPMRFADRPSEFLKWTPNPDIPGLPDLGVSTLFRGFGGEDLAVSEAVALLRACLDADGGPEGPFLLEDSSASEVLRGLERQAPDVSWDVLEEAFGEPGPASLGRAAVTIARELLAEGRAEDARWLSEGAYGLALRHHLRELQCHAAWLLGECLVATGDRGGGASFLGRAARTAQEVGALHAAVTIAQSLADLQQDMGRLRESAATVQGLRQMARAGEFPDVFRWCSAELRRLAVLAGDHAASLEASAALAGVFEDPMDEDGGIWLGHDLLWLGHLEDATRVFEWVLNTSRSNGGRALAFSGLRLLSACHAQPDSSQRSAVLRDDLLSPAPSDAERAWVLYDEAWTLLLLETAPRGDIRRLFALAREHARAHAAEDLARRCMEGLRAASRPSGGAPHILNPDPGWDEREILIKIRERLPGEY